MSCINSWSGSNWPTSRPSVYSASLALKRIPSRITQANYVQVYEPVHVLTGPGSGSLICESLCLRIQVAAAAATAAVPAPHSAICSLLSSRLSYSARVFGYSFHTPV